MKTIDGQPRSTRALLELAFATFARHLLPLGAILAVGAVPAGIATAVAVATAAYLATVPQAVAVRTLEAHASAPAVALALAVIGAVYLLARTAAIVYVWDALDGAPPDIATAYRRAAGRWLSQITVGLTFVVLMLLVEFVLLFIVVSLTVLGPGARPSALTAWTGTIVLAVSYAFEDFTALMASVSAATDARGPLAAIRNGLRRTFDRPFLRRTTAAAAVLTGIEWCLSFVVLSVAQAAFLVSRGPLSVAFVAAAAAAGVVVLEGARVVLSAVFTRDVRFRREGADLTLACAREDELPAGADGLSASDRALIAQYLARHASLDPRASVAIAAQLAARVRPKLRASFDYLDDLALFEHLARSK